MATKNKWASKILRSLGLKRKVAGFLSAVLAIAVSIPEGAQVVPYIMNVAAFFGVTGLLHAVPKGTLLTYKSATISAALSAVIAFATQYGLFLEYMPILIVLAGLFGARAVSEEADSEDDK